jgi:uncharacterized PurR-regulated membrane protein YhhQ (DUF165 family)
MTGQSTRQDETPESPASAETIPWQDVNRALRLAGMLVTSVAITLYIIWISWTWTAFPLTVFDGVLSPAGIASLYPSIWLTWGHASITAMLLVTNLVNRRYGEQVALAHVLATAAIAALAALAASSGVIHLPSTPAFAPNVRQVAALLTGFTLGQAASVLVFDRTRGVEWWNAPAYAALTATLIAMPVFYLLAFAGSDWVWLHHMAIDIALKALMSFALLVPYFLLRTVIRPSEGLGGY